MPNYNIAIFSACWKICCILLLFTPPLFVIIDKYTGCSFILLMSCLCYEQKQYSDRFIPVYSKCRGGTLRYSVTHGYTFTKLYFCCACRPVSSVVTHRYQCRRFGVQFSNRSNRTQSRHRLATAATILRSCVTTAISRGDGRSHSLHALV